MRETPCYRLIIFLTCLMMAAQIQAQCGRPNVGENMLIIGDTNLQSFPNGTTLTFRCVTGYTPVVSSASRTITCIEPEWTELQLQCTKKSCGPLGELPNGRYTYPNGTLFGATAVAQCNEGYVLVGEQTRNCRDFGWDGRDPVCEAVKCLPPPTIENGQFEPVEEFYNYNQPVSYTCNKDYTLIGESTISCSSNGTFQPSPPQCMMIKCETPNITNAVRVEGKPPPYGYKNFVRYECIGGYTMSGSGELVCEVHGWEPSLPTCIPHCGRPNVGESMVMVNDTNLQTFLSGTTLIFQCVTGYTPVDSSASRTITCTGHEWTELQLKCTKKSCGPLGELPNGRYTYPNGTLFGATAVAQCNEGYVLLGDKTRNCRDNGWDGRDPVCEAVKCSPPPTIENGQFEPVEEFYNYNQAVSYTCNKDYTLIGESTISCSSNKTFQPSPPRCLMVECETPNITNAVRVEGKPPPYGYKNVVRYECIEGYTMSGSGELVCEVHGWEPSLPTCILSQIPHPSTTSPPSDGTHVQPSVIIIAVVVTIGLVIGTNTEELLYK